MAKCCCSVQRCCRSRNSLACVARHRPWRGITNKVAPELFGVATPIQETLQCRAQSLPHTRKIAGLAGFWAEESSPMNRSEEARQSTGPNKPVRPSFAALFIYNPIAVPGTSLLNTPLLKSVNLTRIFNIKLRHVNNLNSFNMLSNSIVAMTVLARFAAAQSVHGAGALGTGKNSFPWHSCWLKI